MDKQLPEEERWAQVAQAVNADAARKILEMLQGAGLGPAAIIAASITAATAVIEHSYLPADRLQVLNSMLAETIYQWAALR